MTLSLRALRYVQAALQRGSIASAAEAMHVAPSAIAAALDQAETAFGMTLVTRARSKGVSPTLAGRDVQRRIDDLLERYDTLLSDVADLQRGLSGSLSVGYNAPIAPAFLPALGAAMLAEHPAISLSLTECDNTTVQKGLLDGQFDAIIFVAEIPNPQIETQTLIFAPTYCLCAADHRFARTGTAPLCEIAREPLIMLDRPAARSHYMALLDRSGEPFRIVATSNSTEMVRSLVASGLGVALLNMRPRNTMPYAGRETRSVRISDTSNGISLSVGSAAGPKRRLVQLFIDRCTAWFEGPEGAQVIVAPI